MGTELQKTQSGTGLQQARPVQTVYYTPRVDVLENEDQFVLFADLPGVKPDSLNLTFENGELTVHGRCEQRAYTGAWVFAEYGVGDFYRTFTLGEQIDPERIAAELKNGVLTVRLPKKETVKPRRIQVKAE